MNGYIVVDASVWVARLVAGDVFHQTSLRWLDEQRQGGRRFLSPGLLLAEVAGAISRRSADRDLARRAVAALRDLPSLRLVSMDDALVQHAAELAAEYGLRGTDAFYVAVAARLGAPLATLDEDQRQRAANLVAVESPS